MRLSLHISMKNAGRSCWILDRANGNPDHKLLKDGTTSPSILSMSAPMLGVMNGIHSDLAVSRQASQRGKKRRLSMLLNHQMSLKLVCDALFYAELELGLYGTNHRYTDDRPIAEGILF